MAMLLLRSGGLSSTPKIPLSSLTYTKDQAGSSSMIQDENQHHHHPQQQRSSRSSRKSKNGQKKIPQRGLGVAQLEKLRMEEQQKQEAACLASLQRAHSLPPLTAALHSQGASLVFARQMKGRGLPSHPFPHHISSRNGCTGSSDSIISLANLPSLNLKQLPMGFGPQQHHSSREENNKVVDRSVSRNSSLGRSSEGVESCVTNVGVANTGFLSGLWHAQNASGENLNQEMEMRKMQFFGLRLQNSSGPPNDLRLFEPLLRPPAPARKLPVVSISSSGAAMQMEPPSNQIYSTTPPWTEEDRIAGIKRSWPFSQENPSSLIQPKASYLNVGVGIHVKAEDTADPNPTRMEVPKRGPTAVFRNPLTISLEPLKKKTTWQANSELASPCSKHRSDLSISFDSANTPRICCVGQGTVKDSCSSSTSLQPGFTLNWKGSAENDASSQDNETPGGAFLTLGLSGSANENFHDKGNHCKQKQHSTTSDTSDECQLPQLSAHLQKEIAGEMSTRTIFPSSGLLKHGSVDSTECGHLDEGCVPFYKFLSYESSNKGSENSICRDGKAAGGVAKESVDLNLRLSL